MAYQRVYDRWSTEWTFVADSDSDVTDVADDNPDAPVGSVILANNSGSPAVYVKFPAGSFSKIN